MLNVALVTYDNLVLYIISTFSEHDFIKGIYLFLKYAEFLTIS
jgi:hypothetical protein